jgi:mono/diheme cytochrome c family protein
MMDFRLRWRRPAGWFRPAGLGLLLGLALGASLRGEEPAAIFSRACAPCHGKNGKAQTPIGRKLKVKDLTQSKTDEHQIAEQIREGKKGEDGLTRMPSFKESLKPDEIAALVQYVKSLRPRVPTGASAKAERQ